VVGDLIIYICSCELTSITRKINVKNLTTGETFIDEADFVVGARGAFTRTLWPKIDGLWDFSGKVVHSGHWDKE
jgi:cation diffusion facilitator CzcD-associated flavoprotein CzcO